MTLPAAMVMEIRSTATAGNLNGGGFNPANTHGPTDGVIASGTGNSPTLTSATYSFSAADVSAGVWVYFPAQTNMTAGWYQIASQSGGVATLKAAVGQAIQVNNNRYNTNTVAGCATTAAPTGVTFLVDYTQADAAIMTHTDLTCTAASTTVTSAAATFTPVMVGNFIHLTALTGTGAIVGWYEIVSYTNATNVVLDRTPTNGSNNITAGTYYVGGALSLGSSDDAVFELAVASSTAAARYFIQGGSSITYTLGGTVSIAAAGNAAWPIICEGYAATRGDRPTGATRPTLACGAATLTWGALWDRWSLILTGTAASVDNSGASSFVINCKAVNSSTTAARAAFKSSSTTYINCEGISYRGRAFDSSAAAASINMQGCYAHDSDTGIIFGSGQAGLSNNIVAGCVTTAINNSTAGSAATQRNITNNTIYGAENKLGTGVSFVTGAANAFVVNNILYGLATGVSHADTQTVGYDNFNNYYNNTNDVSAAGQWQKGNSDTAINPSFTNVAQRTGSTATTTAGNHLVQSGATFITWGVTAGVDYVYISGGTGVTAGVYGIASVDSETQITTDITLAADATGDKVWSITTGHNYAIGVGLKALAIPGVFPGGSTQGYLDQGAVQRQEPSASGGGSYAFC